MPAAEVDFHHEFGELVRELRALPTAAPAAVRSRVSELGEPAPKRSLRDLTPKVSVRRSLLVLAPACVVGLVAAALIHGLIHSGNQERTSLVNGSGVENVGAGGATDQGTHFGAVTTPPFAAPSLPTPSSGRYQDYQASLTLRVKDVATLHDRTAQAAQLARSYGGYVASVDEATGGADGRSDLVLRIPVSRVQDAYFRLAQLGTVTAQHLSIRDLDGVVQAQRRRIVQLRVLIAKIGETLKNRSLPADVRLRLELQRDAARQDLAAVTGSNKATLREASLSKISLTLTAQRAGVPARGSSTRIERAARSAGSFLVGTGAVLLFVLIVVSPLLVVALALAFGTRAYRRREERRLLSAA